MLLRYLSVLGDAPEAFLILVAAFGASILIGLAFHEFSHALAADNLGDRTPRSMGRLSLDPRRHLDPLGSAMIFFVGFGWAKPVQVNPMNTRNPRQSMVLIASAGPVSNLVMAGLAAIPIKAGWVPFFHPFIDPRAVDLAASIWVESPENLIGLFLGTVVFINVILAVFNLVPIYPLDGSRVLVGLLPPDLASVYRRYERWMPGLLLLLIILPFMTGGEFSPLFDAMGPLIQFILDLFVGEGVAPRIA